MPQYYRPRIEEFHHGFEYVVENDDSHHTLTYNMGDDIRELLTEDRIRVAQLSNEQIESMGFKVVWPLPDMTFVRAPDYVHFSLEEFDSSSKFLFKFNELESYLIVLYDGEHIYRGDVPNINEFKRLLSRLGIILAHGD